MECVKASTQNNSQCYTVFENIEHRERLGGACLRITRVHHTSLSSLRIGTLLAVTKDERQGFSEFRDAHREGGRLRGYGRGCRQALRVRMICKGGKRLAWVLGRRLPDGDDVCARVRATCKSADMSSAHLEERGKW